MYAVTAVYICSTLEMANLLILAYMYGEAPFSSPPSDLSQRLNWWKSLAKDSGARILAVSSTDPSSNQYQMSITDCSC